MYYARDISWGELGSDGTVTATFDLYEGDSLSAEGLTVTASVQFIQDAIVATAKGLNGIPSEALTFAESVDLYSAIAQNSELFFE